MIHTWWLAHQFEFVIAGIGLAVIALILLIVWLISKVKEGK